MKDKLREHCPANLQEEIMGHSRQGVAENYETGYSRELKREALEKVWAGTE